MNAAIIAAAGGSRRFGADDKQFAPLLGRPVLWHSASALARSEAVDVIVIVTRRDNLGRCRDEIGPTLGDGIPVEIVEGGTERQHSVKLGLDACPSETDAVFVHDGARPLIIAREIKSAAESLGDWDGLIFAEPMADTVKAVEGDRVSSTLPRDNLWRAQTPQIFKYAGLLAAYAAADRNGFVGTDESALIERAGGRIKVFPYLEPNPKITTVGDLRMAELILRDRATSGRQ